MNFALKYFYSFSIILVFSLFFVSNAHAASYDLDVADIVVSPAIPAIGEAVEIKIKVKNNNITPLVDLQGINSYEVRFDDFSLDAVVLPTISTDKPINYNEFFYYIVKGSFNEIGTSRLYFYANKNQSLPETSFGNNYIRKDVVVREADDLKLKTITMEPAYVSVGQKTKITITLINNGVRDLLATNGVNSYLLNFPDFTVEDKTLPEISNTSRFVTGAEVQYFFEGRFKTSGEKKLSFQVDYSNDLKEFNEENNYLEKITTVASESDIDLGIDSIAFSKDSSELLVGDSVTISVVVKNEGGYSLLSGEGFYERNYKLSYGGDFEYNAPDLDVYEVTYPVYPTETKPLDPDSKLTYTLRAYVIRAGESTFSATVDRANLLEETNEENNTLVSKFTAYKDAAARDDFEVFDITCKAISSTSLEIIWRTSKAVGNYLQFKAPLESYFNAMQKLKDQKWLDSNNKKDHSITVSDLSPDTQYFYIINSRNNDVEKESAEMTCSTPLNDPVEVTEDLSAEASEQEEQKPEETEEVDPVEACQGMSPSTDCEPSQELEIKPITIQNQSLYKSISGKIILKVESAGEAYYVNPQSQEMHYLGRPDDAFSVMRSQGVGITNLALSKIPIGLTPVNGPDSDNDGLSDALEDALGTNKELSDTDSDGFSDKDELGQNYNPLGTTDLILDKDFARKQAGKIFLQVEAHGEAWYLNPADQKRYFLGRPDDAFAIMRQLGLGISDINFDSL